MRTFARAAMVALGFAVAGPAVAQTTPRILTDQSNLTATTNRITLQRVPVVTSTGAIIYKDVVIDMNVSAAGVVTFPSVTPVQPASPALVTSLAVGRYRTTDGYVFRVTGPGAAPNGRSTWSVVGENRLADGRVGTCSLDFNFTTGAIVGHPMQTRLQAARISLPYTFGQSGNGNPCFWNPNNSYYASRNILAISAITNGFVIRSFSFSSTDYANPQDQVTFTRCVNQTGPAC
jgi:hypothetical protein